MGARLCGKLPGGRSPGSPGNRVAWQRASATETHALRQVSRRPQTGAPGTGAPPDSLPQDRSTGPVPLRRRQAPSVSCPGSPDTKWPGLLSSPIPTSSPPSLITAARNRGSSSPPLLVEWIRTGLGLGWGLSLPTKRSHNRNQQNSKGSQSIPRPGELFSILGECASSGRGVVVVLGWRTLSSPFRAAC